MIDLENKWLEASRETVVSYRQMIDAIVCQLSDEELFARPASQINSVAILLRHLGGNLQSRWTDFLSSDGEKPTRDREQEFCEWEGDRESLLKYFEMGWESLTSTLDELDNVGLDQSVTIRGESHSVPQAIARSLTHISYHVGQIAIIGRMVHKGEWNWLTIAPGNSAKHNAETWGTAASRSIHAMITGSKDKT